MAPGGSPRGGGMGEGGAPGGGPAGGGGPGGGAPPGIDLPPGIALPREEGSPTEGGGGGGGGGGVAAGLGAGAGPPGSVAGSVGTPGSIYLSPAGSVALGLFPEGTSTPQGVAAAPAAQELQLASELFQAKETIRSLLEELRDAERSLSQSQAPGATATTAAATEVEGSDSVSKPRGTRVARRRGGQALAEPSPEIALQGSPGNASVSAASARLMAWPEDSAGPARSVSDGSTTTSGGLRQFRRNIDELQAIRAENKRLREKCSRQDQELVRVRGRAEDLDRMRGELLRELHQKGENAKGPKDLQRALLQQEEALGDLGSRLEEELGKSKKLADRCFSQKNRVQLLEKRLEARDNLIEKQNCIIREAVEGRGAAEAQSATHLQAARSLRKLIQQAEGEHNGAEGRVCELFKEVEHLARSCGELEAVAKAEALRRGALAATLTSAQARSAELEGEARAYEQRLASLEDTAAALERRHAAELLEARERCADAEQRCAALQAEVGLRLQESERRRSETEQALQAAQREVEELRGVQAYDGGKLQALSDVVGLLHGHLTAQRRFRHAASDGLQSLSFDNFPGRGKREEDSSPGLEPFFVSPGGELVRLADGEGAGAPGDRPPTQMIAESESQFLDSPGLHPGGSPPGLESAEEERRLSAGRDEPPPDPHRGEYARRTRATLSAVRGAASGWSHSGLRTADEECGRPFPGGKAIVGGARRPSSELRAAGALAARLIRAEQHSPGVENAPDALLHGMESPAKGGVNGVESPPAPGTPSNGRGGGQARGEGRTSSVRDLRALRQVSKNLKERLTAAKRGPPGGRKARPRLAEQAR